MDRFQDRADAGIYLAERLKKYADKPNTIVNWPLIWHHTGLCNICKTRRPERRHQLLSAGICHRGDALRI